MNIASTLKHTVGAALLAGALLMVPTAANARVFLSVNIAPPVIPVYEQPACPGDGYIWTPGYWAWNDYNAGYEWVEGSWVVAPYTGALWTPGYWGFNNGAYLWNAGYWGREVGYYGGVNYGFGYFGTGFYGGYWGGDRFFYNRAYNRLDERREHNFYERREAGFDGRPGGASFDHRYAEHGGYDQNRGSFAGNRDYRNDNHRNFDDHGGFGNDRRHDDHRNVDDRRSFNGQDNSRTVNPAESRTFSGTNNRQPFQGDQGINNRQPWEGGRTDAHTNYQTDPNRQLPNQGFQGGNRTTYQAQPQPRQDQSFSGNRSGFQGQPAQPSQPQQPRPDQGFAGGRSNFPTQPTQVRPDPRFSGGDFRGNAIRSNNAPAMNNNNNGGGGRSFSGSNPGTGNQGSNQGGANQGNSRGGNSGGGGNFRGGDHR